MIAEQIIAKAEKEKQSFNSNMGGGVASNLNLSDIIDAYKKIMKKNGIDTTNESYYYAMMVKLSLNNKGKTWR